MLYTRITILHLYKLGTIPQMNEGKNMSNGLWVCCHSVVAPPYSYSSTYNHQNNDNSHDDNNGRKKQCLLFSVFGDIKM